MRVKGLRNNSKTEKTGQRGKSAQPRVHRTGKPHTHIGLTGSGTGV
ncbi:hypothetical protein F383_29282 [Gossypium arboreum]|uniref:Uncharacterized protein n=1 Tax=Gossypium arboreum TaxID=29729 RepID=A0A0B0MWZ7_GOSAR|nr:hypothetical protein F383_29282 [Gossypium arboreum]